MKTFNNESQLQQACFMWHWNNFPDERGALYLIHNNPKNRIHGAILKGLGLMRGASDLGYIMHTGKTAYIEMKMPGKYQMKVQKEWQKLVESRRGQYYVIKTFEDFKDLINLLKHQ